MKPIKVGNLDIGVKMKPTGVADLEVGVKMKRAEQKMKLIRVSNPDVEVKMKETGVGIKPIDQILFDGFCFECDVDD